MNFLKSVTERDKTRHGNDGKEIGYLFKLSRYHYKNSVRTWAGFCFCRNMLPFGGSLGAKGFYEI